ncbi:MAG: multicopper oxidase domain-containing protein [Halorientalis sp.]
MLLLLVGVAVGAAAPADAHEAPTPEDGTDGGRGGTEPLCAFDHPEWRSPTFIAGVRIGEDPSCRPDNPAVVAAVTKGTNNVDSEVLARTGLHDEAVVKRTDADGDGDPDVIHVTLEIMGLNEYNATGATHAIAPGIRPAFWVFAPKTRGMLEQNAPATRLVRMPSPPLRVEAGDRVKLTVENTHYLPHTLHLHGVDHPYMVNGSGNDGVPQTSEKPILPGESRTYEFTPRQPGTMYYHCHVVPSVHVTMGLNGMFVVARNRSENYVQTINVGAGRVRHPSKAIRRNYTAAYDLHYQAVDKELHRIPQRYNDPRVVARRTNRVYDRTNATPDYFLLNGRSFPYTLRESMVIVQPDERYRLRILNGGSETVSLHTHGHKVTVEAKDGVSLSEDEEVVRDVVTLTAAQRLDVTLNTTNDGLHSYGQGVWFLHDHREEAVTTDGISPGGDVSLIVYRNFLRADGMPVTETNLSQYFSTAYYEGEIPFWRDLDAKHLGAPPGTPDRTTHLRLPRRDRVPIWMRPGTLAVIGLLGMLVFLGLMGGLLYRGGETS